MTDKNLTPDNEYMRNIALAAENLHIKLSDDIAILRNEQGDLFSRYIAMFRLINYLKTAENGMEVFMDAFASGFAVSHQLLQTKEAKKNGWDKIDLDDNPFFEQKECESCSLDELMEEAIAKFEYALKMVEEKENKKNAH